MEVGRLEVGGCRLEVSRWLELGVLRSEAGRLEAGGYWRLGWRLGDGGWSLVPGG